MESEGQEVRMTKRHGVMHTYPANEGCNLDQAAHQVAVIGPAQGRKHPYYKRDCKRCFDPEGG